MPIEEAKWISKKILEDIGKAKISFDLWCNYKNIALRIKANCPDSTLGICLYSVLYNRFFSMSVCFREMGHKILKAESFSDENIKSFEDKYVTPYVYIDEFV